MEEEKKVVKPTKVKPALKAKVSKVKTPLEKEDKNAIGSFIISLLSFLFATPLPLILALPSFGVTVAGIVLNYVAPGTNLSGIFGIIGMSVSFVLVIAALLGEVFVGIADELLRKGSKSNKKAFKIISRILIILSALIITIGLIIGVISFSLSVVLFVLMF